MFLFAVPVDIRRENNKRTVCSRAETVLIVYTFKNFSEVDRADYSTESFAGVAESAAAEVESAPSVGMEGSRFSLA